MKLSQKSLNGFTLIELMIAVAIVGILAAIAYPSYSNSVIKSRRADVTGALQGFANGMERRFTEFNTFCDVGGATVAGVNDNSTGADTCGAAGTNDTGYPIAAIFATQSPMNGTTKYYNLTIDAVTATSYTLRATPISGGSQAANGKLELTSTGIRRWDRNNDNDFLDTDETKWE